MFSIVLPQKLIKLILLIISGFYLTGCGISNRATLPEEQTPSQTETRAENDEPIPMAMNISSSIENLTSIERQLQNAHQQWKGTPYRYGGNGDNGIDCSAFTQTVFRDFFDRNLPRHTSGQLQIGSGIRRRSIQTGDLIFFKTGRQSLHVGISMGDGDFLHASVSSGVMISNIRDKYWAVRYLGARRVL